jgi:cell division protein ZapD
LHEWVAPYIKLEEVIELILTTIRDSAAAKPVVAEKGFYQQSLDTKRSTQLIRISVGANELIYPEVSAGKHRYSVRFMQVNPGDTLATQVKEDVKFLLSRCSL